MIETLTGGLHASAKRELTTLLQQMAPSSYTLTIAPATLEELAQALENHKCAPHKCTIAWSAEHKTAVLLDGCTMACDVQIELMSATLLDAPRRA